MNIIIVIILITALITDQITNPPPHLSMIAKIAAVPPPRLWPTHTNANLSVPWSRLVKIINIIIRLVKTCQDRHSL